MQDRYSIDVESICQTQIENKTLTYIYRKEISESYKDWVIHNLDQHSVDRFDGDKETAGLRCGGGVAVCVAWSRSCPASAVHEVSSYIDTDPYSFCWFLNVLLVKYL